MEGKTIIYVTRKILNYLIPGKQTVHRSGIFHIGSGCPAFVISEGDILHRGLHSIWPRETMIANEIITIIIKQI